MVKPEAPGGRCGHFGEVSRLCRRGGFHGTIAIGLLVAKQINVLRCFSHKCSISNNCASISHGEFHRNKSGAQFIRRAGRCHERNRKKPKSAASKTKKWCLEAVGKRPNTMGFDTDFTQFGTNIHQDAKPRDARTHAGCLPLISRSKLDTVFITLSNDGGSTRNMSRIA